MESYASIDNLIAALNDPVHGAGPEAAHQRAAIAENPGMVDLLRMLERTNPCGQRYYRHEHVIFITYDVRWPLLPIAKQAISLRLRFVGLPVSLSTAGCLIASADQASRAAIGELTRAFADRLRGITIVLNSDVPIAGGAGGLSSFTFHNRFERFEDYLAALRSSYRRKLGGILERGRDLRFSPVAGSGFTQAHYDLYLSVCARSTTFRILPLSYFRDSDAELFETRDQKGRLLAMVQLKPVDGTLYFVYVGFRKSEAETARTVTRPSGSDRTGHPDADARAADDDDGALDAVDLYYNLLLFIIRHGIENGYRKIAFGQTSAESKSKIGCSEARKYIYVTARNRLVRSVFQRFRGAFAFEPYGIDHKVFKEPLADSGTVPERRAIPHLEPEPVPERSGTVSVRSLDAV